MGSLLFRGGLWAVAFTCVAGAVYAGWGRLDPDLLVSQVAAPGGDEAAKSAAASLRDRWGRPYVILYPMDYVYSLGPDGVDGSGVLGDDVLVRTSMSLFGGTTQALALRAALRAQFASLAAVWVALLTLTCSCAQAIPRTRYDAAVCGALAALPTLAVADTLRRIRREIVRLDHPIAPFGWDDVLPTFTLVPAPVAIGVTSFGMFWALIWLARRRVVASPQPDMVRA